MEIREAKKEDLQAIKDLRYDLAIFEKIQIMILLNLNGHIQKQVIKILNISLMNNLYMYQKKMEKQLDL